MNLTPTNDARVFETQWFVDPKQPLLETKLFYAKTDDFIAVVSSSRGPTQDMFPPQSDGEVKSYTLNDKDGYDDTSRDAFNALIKYLDSPVRA